MDLQTPNWNTHLHNHLDVKPTIGNKYDTASLALSSIDTNILHNRSTHWDAIARICAPVSNTARHRQSIDWFQVRSITATTISAIIRQKHIRVWLRSGPHRRMCILAWGCRKRKVPSSARTPATGDLQGLRRSKSKTRIATMFA